MDDVIDNYNTSGQLTMIVQEFIEWDQFIRCLSIGQADVLPMVRPRERNASSSDHLSPELGDRIVRDSELSCARSADMCSLEFAVRGGVVRHRLHEPAPDMDINSLTPHYFEWAVGEWRTWR
jgi:hypothetical protein